MKNLLEEEVKDFIFYNYGHFFFRNKTDFYQVLSKLLTTVRKNYAVLQVQRINMIKIITSSSDVFLKSHIKPITNKYKQLKST